MDDREGSRLLLSHDYDHDLAAAMTLDEGLAHLASSPSPASSSTSTSSCPATRRAWSRRCAPTAWSSARSSRAPSCAAWWRCARSSRGCGSAGRSRARGATTPPRALWMLPAYAMVARIRRRLPAAAVRHLAAGRCDAVMAHWRLVTPALVQAVAGAGGELYVWTVDDAARIRALEAMGVTGVITTIRAFSDARAPAGAVGGVMKCANGRSTGVNSAMTLPAAAPAQHRARLRRALPGRARRRVRATSPTCCATAAPPRT